MYYSVNPLINIDHMMYLGTLPYTYNDIVSIFGKECRDCIWPIECYFNKNICLSVNDTDNVISLYGDQNITQDNILDISDYIYGHSLEDFNTNDFLSDFIKKNKTI
jgi:hypothetical protein